MVVNKIRKKIDFLLDLSLNMQIKHSLGVMASEKKWVWTKPTNSGNLHKERAAIADYDWWRENYNSWQAWFVTILSTKKEAFLAAKFLQLWRHAISSVFLFCFWVIQL